MLANVRNAVATCLLATLLGPASGVCFQGSYKVGKGDVLTISIPGSAEFTLDATTVSDLGTISFPLVGDVAVDGLTVSQIADRIRIGIVERKLLTQPSVSVVVREYRSQSVTVLGEVRTTGKYMLKGPETLLSIIAAAGGFTSLAGDIAISRKLSSGDSENLMIKSADMLGNASGSNPPVVSGDVVYVKVKEVSQVFVSGEVTTERPIPYVEGLTVYQAIVIAGGITRFGNKNRVTLKRNQDGKEELIKVKLADIERGKAKDIPLLPNDQVIVGRRVF